MHLPKPVVLRARVRAGKVATVLAVLLALDLPAQTNRASRGDSSSDDVTQAFLREHYTKFEHEIPMRDGVKLFTAVYAPKDDSESYPLLLTRTPYSVRPYSVDRYPDPRGPLAQAAKEKFIFVFQDVRGRNGSVGEFGHMRPHRPVK